LHEQLQLLQEQQLLPGLQQPIKSTCALYPPFLFERNIMQEL
jgi:hypothetical protein